MNSPLTSSSVVSHSGKRWFSAFYNNSLAVSLVLALGGSLGGSMLGYGAGSTDKDELKKALLQRNNLPQLEENAPTAPKLSDDEKFAAILQSVGIYFSQRRFDEATAKLNEAAAMRPDSPEVQGARAGIFAESGKIAEARVIYDKMVAADPKGFIPRFNQAELFTMEKNYDEARRRFEVLLTEFPDSEFLKLKVLLTYVAQKNLEKAAEWGEKLKHPKPTPYMYYGAAAMAITSGDIMGGKRLIVAAEHDFGAGKFSLLYQSLAGIGLVLQSEYPPVVQ